MSRQPGRRIKPRKKTPRIVAGVGVAAAGLVTALAVTTPWAGSASADGDTSECTDSITVGVAPAYVEHWTSVAQEFTKTSGSCDVTIEAAVPADVAQGQTDGLDAWIPDDVSALSAMADEVSAEVSSVSPDGAPAIVATTPLVLVAPQQLADAAGLTTGAFSDSDLRDMILNDKSWSDYGHQEWGNLRLALPDPAATGAGARGFLGLTMIATNNKPPQKISYLKPSKSQLGLLRLEHRLVAVASDESSVLEDFGDLSKTSPPDDVAGPRMAVTTEAAFVAAELSETARAMHISGGTLGIEMPYVPLKSSEAVEDFGSWLATEKAFEAIGRAGLRTGGFAPEPSALSDSGVLTSAQETPDQLPVETVMEARQNFASLHARISTVIAIDLSGSMNEMLPGSSTVKYDAVKRLGSVFVKLASPHSRGGLITFQSDPADRMMVKTVAKLDTNWKPRSKGKNHLEDLVDQISKARPSGGTPLYNAIAEAYEMATDGYDESMSVNQVIVLTDGDNRDARGSISEAELIKKIKKLRNPDRPIRLSIMGYGPETNMKAVRRIAKAVDARAGIVSSVDELESVASELIFDFE